MPKRKIDKIRVKKPKEKSTVCFYCICDAILNDLFFFCFRSLFKILDIKKCTKITKTSHFLTKSCQYESSTVHTLLCFKNSETQTLLTIRIWNQKFRRNFCCSRVTQDIGTCVFKQNVVKSNIVQRVNRYML